MAGWRMVWYGMVAVALSKRRLVTEVAPRPRNFLQSFWKLLGLVGQLYEGGSLLLAVLLLYLVLALLQLL